MTGSKVRERKQKKVQIELKCGYHGQNAQLVISLTPKQVRSLLRLLSMGFNLTTIPDNLLT